MNSFVFDLYGTLIDVHSDEQSAHTWKTWCKELDKRKIKYPDYIKFRNEFFALDKQHRIQMKEKRNLEYPEIDIIEVYRELFASYGNRPLSDQELTEISYAFRVASRSSISLYPGVEEYLKKLAELGKDVYILSNAQRSYTWPEIQMFGLDKLTKGIILSSDYGVMKPDKAIFEILLRKFSLEREDVLMHGDSLTSDVEGAKNAGMQCIHLAGEMEPNKFYMERLAAFAELA